MKKMMLLITILVIGATAAAQKYSAAKSVNYEAAHWKTWLLDNPEQISIAAPVSQSVKGQLQAVRQRISGVDQKGMEEIKYWNAGAPAYRWNQIAPKLIEQKPELMLRTPTAWMNIAIYDATVLAWKEKIRYKRNRPHLLDPSIKPLIDAPLTYAYPCEHSVTAAAAAHVLSYFFPDKKDSILSLAHAASQSRIDAGVQLESDVEAGWSLGEQVAKKIIEKAKLDDSAKEWKGEVNKDPRKWTGAYPMGIQLTQFTPLVIQAPNQFRPAAPPDFEEDMKSLKSFKQTFKSRSLAYYWANSGGYGFWSEVAGTKMFEYRMMDDAPAVARIYAVLHTAYHDAAIAIMDAKYAYWGIRPAQHDTTYKPLISTPPFPGYPSGHAAGAATTSAVLGHFFPADAAVFQQFAQDCADSRFYAGIHFRTDNETGLSMGRELGKYVVKTWFENTTGKGESRITTVKSR